MAKENGYNLTSDFFCNQTGIEAKPIEWEKLQIDIIEFWKIFGNIISVISLGCQIDYSKAKVI